MFVRNDNIYELLHLYVQKHKVSGVRIKPVSCSLVSFNARF